METITYYGLPIEVKEMREEESINGLKEFFNLGKKWTSEGFKVYYRGVSGVTNAFIWNAIRPEVTECAECIESFIHLVGPCISYDRAEGHPLIKLALDKRFKEKVTVGLLDVRAICHEMLIWATKSELSQLERGLLIVEKPHDVLSTVRQKAILDIEKDYGSIFKLSKSNLRDLFSQLQENFKCKEALSKRIENPDDCCRLTDQGIKLIAKESGVDFDSITTEEIGIIVKRLGLEDVPVVGGDKY